MPKTIRIEDIEEAYEQKYGSDDTDTARPAKKSRTSATEKRRRSVRAESEDEEKPVKKRRAKPKQTKSARRPKKQISEAAQAAKEIISVNLKLVKLKSALEHYATQIGGEFYFEEELLTAAVEKKVQSIVNEYFGIVEESSNPLEALMNLSGDFDDS